jgi:hypothetical protein
VEVWARRSSRVADATDLLPSGDRLAGVNLDPGQMGIHRHDAAPVRDRDESAEPVVPARERDPPRHGCADARSLGRREVDPLVEASASGPERAGDVALERPTETDRTLRRRPSKRRERARPGAAVDAETGPGLESEQRLLRPFAEDGVEPPGGKPVPGEVELERRDVEADHSSPQHPAADAVSAVPPQCAKRPRTGDAVDLDVRPLLQTPNGRPRARPEHAVHGSAVETLHRQPGLEGGDMGAPPTPGRGGECQCDGEGGHGAGPHGVQFGGRGRLPRNIFVCRA